MIAITDAPIFGYGITEKMSAIRPHLTISINPNFSHPHNDIFAGTIGGEFWQGFSLFFHYALQYLRIFSTQIELITLYLWL